MAISTALPDRGACDRYSGDKKRNTINLIHRIYIRNQIGNWAHIHKVKEISLIESFYEMVFFNYFGTVVPISLLYYR